MADDEEGVKFDHIFECPQREDATAECKCEVNGVYCICIICRRPFSKAEVWNSGECPECGTKFKPLWAGGLCDVKIHWHELQSLACWAEQYGAAFSEQCPDIKKAIYAITQEIEAQHPMNSPLTLGRELGIIGQTKPVWPAGNVEPIPPKTRLQ